MNHRHAAVSSTALAGVLALLVCSAAVAQPSPAFKRLAPKGLADSQKLWNYSHVIALEPSARLVEVAGTTGDDESGNMVSPDLRAQVAIRSARAFVALGLVAAATATANATANAADQTQHHRHACSNARTITVNPPTLLDPTPFGYKHITLDTRNAVAYVAGQVAFSLGGQIVGSTLNEQLVLTEQNLRFALSALDADVQDIMRMNVFVKNFQQNQDLPVLEPFLFRMGSPVDAVLGVTSLAIDGLLVEVQMTVAVRQATVERIRCSRRG